MFRRDAFARIALCLVGLGVTFYAAIGSTPFSPKSLQSEIGECPANNQFYPAEVRPVLEDYEAEWYSSSLMGFHERPIFLDSEQEHRTYRFTLMRSFDAGAMVRTTETQDGRIRLIGKLMQGPDGCVRTARACAVDRILSPSEQARLLKAQAPMLQKASFGCPTGIDGSMWVMEASGGGDYRFWSEWSPVRGELRALAMVMLDLTGWNLNEIY